MSVRESAQTRRIRLSHDEAAGPRLSPGRRDQFGKLFLRRWRKTRTSPPGQAVSAFPLADRSELSIFPRLSTYSQIVAKLQWEPAAIDLAPDARAWTRLPDERRRRLTTLLAGLPGRRGRRRRAPHAVRRSRRARRHHDDVDLLPAAPRRGPPRAVLRSRRRRGAPAARRYPGRAARRRAGARPGRVARAVRGAPAGDGRRAGGGARRHPRRRPRSITWCSRERCSPPGSAPCSTTWTTARCPGFARALSTSSSTSAGTSVSACAA